MAVRVYDQAVLADVEELWKIRAAERHGKSSGNERRATA